MHKEQKLLLALALLALVLRLIGAGAYFTGDEIDTVGPARSFALSGDFRVYDTPEGPYYNFTHPPVRTLLYAYWAAWLGFSNIALRLVPIIFGALFVAVVFYLGKTFYSTRAGLIAAGLVAVSRYAIWFSDTVSVDTGHFLFTTAAAALFFAMYIRQGKRPHLALSFLFLLVSMLTKFSTLIIFIPIAAGAFLYKKKCSGAALVLITAAMTPISMLAVSAVFDSREMFQQPLDVFIQYSGGTAPSMSEYIFNKIFKLATITWQMTPFFAVLLLASLFSLKRTKEFWILSSWLVIGFLVIFAPYGQDSQRYFGVALTPAFILIAKYLESFDFKNKAALVAIAVTAAVSALMGLNDLMGYYAPVYLGIFYAAALAAVLYRRHMKNILVGGFVGLSIFFALTHAGNYYIVSDAVENLSSKATERGYHHTEVWTSKDIAYYITPPDRAEYVNPIPDISFFTKENIAKNGVKYMAFYSTLDENKIKEAAKFCTDPYMYSSYGHTIGFVCKIDQSKL